MSAAEFKAKGNAALQAKDYDEAIAHYTKAIELEPSNHVFYSNRSAAYLSKGDAQAALSDADLCIKANSTWAKGFSRKGAALHSLKKYDDAVQAYKDGLLVAPEDDGLKRGLDEVTKAQAPPPMGGLGQLFGPDMITKLAGHPKFGKYLGDSDFLLKLQMLQSNPQNLSNLQSDPRILEVMGFLLGVDISGAPGAPEAAAPPAASGSTPPAPAAAASSEPMQEEEVEEEELDEEEKLVRENKKKATSMNVMQAEKVRGNAHYAKKEFAEAVAAYDAAIALDSTNMKYLNNKAAVLFEQKEYEACMALCKEAVAVGRSNRADYQDVAKSYLRAGKAAAKMGNLELAIEEYKTAQVEHYTKEVERLIKNTELEQRKKVAAAYVDPEKALEAKERGNEFFRSGSWPDAIREYEDAIKRDPSNAVYRNNLASALTKIGDFNAAKNACEKALELDPKYVKAWSKKGDIEFFMKEYHKALDSYRKGLDIEPGNSLCQQGLQKTTMQINATQGGDVDKERAAHAMADPEIQAIISDPIVRQVLQDMSEDPGAVQKAMSDPVMRAKIEKLIAAGVIRTK
ncbi:unnamed protein product [Chrysoparadoxa australica]